VNRDVDIERPSSSRFWGALFVGVAICGCIYVGFRWSPSSYAIVLQELGVSDTGLIAGVPRPDRGDEFAWQTPLLQMSLRSGFRRFDRTPPYFEDLRTLYAMPIVDWALIFKPQFWPFFVVRPAIAYSFYHFLLIAMFVVGFTILLVRLGGRELDSLLMAVVLFFSAYTQYWWDGASNFFFPFFPWIVLAPLWNIRFGLRLLLFYWLLVSGLLTYFYPPNAIVLGFVAVILWGIARSDLLRWRRMIAVGAAAACASVTVLVYLQEPIAKIAETEYPGHFRGISAGGGLPWQMWLTQIFPTSQMHHHQSLLGINICEQSTIGSIYVLAVLFFLPWGDLVRHSTWGQRRRWIALVLGLFATQSWMMLPLPAWAGYPLLWQLVPPGRMVIAGGLLLLVTVFLFGQAYPLQLSGARSVAFALALGWAWSAFKQPHGIGLLAAFRDWIFVVPVAIVAILQARRLLTPARANTTLLASAAIVGLISFGTYNPIQSTEPIFAKHRTSVTAQLENGLRRNKRGFVLVPFGNGLFAYSGLPLVGLGYPSLTYSTFDPAVDLWRRVYPDLAPDRFRSLFQNAGGFAFGDVPAPRRLPGTLITLSPMAPFLRPGATVCDFIRPSRASFASSVGCGTLTIPSAVGGPPR
jgi:hypothetical protein